MMTIKEMKKKLAVAIVFLTFSTVLTAPVTVSIIILFKYL